MGRAPRPPEGTGEAGRRLWRSVQSEFSLTAADLEILRTAVVMADEISALAALIAASGPLIRDKDGQPVPNPASVQHRLLSAALAKLLCALQVVGEDPAAEHDPDRPQKRSGYRGFYGGGLRAVS